MVRKIEVEFDTYYWYYKSETITLTFRKTISVKTIRKWLSSDKEYRELKKQLKEKEKQYKKLYKKVLRKATKFIKKKYPDAIIRNSYVAIPIYSTIDEYRLFVEFKPNKSWWTATRTWTFGGKRLPELRDDINKIAKLGDEIRQLRKKLNEMQRKIIHDHVKKWIIVVK